MTKAKDYYVTTSYSDELEEKLIERAEIELQMKIDYEKLKNDYDKLKNDYEKLKKGILKHFGGF